MTIKPLLIFTTAYKQFAYEGFQLQAVDYLLKLLNFEDFSKAVRKALAYKKFQDQDPGDQQDGLIYVHSEYKLVKIMLRDIEYLESMEDYIKIHVGGEKPILTLMTLKKMLELLPPGQFVRIHRCYVVSVSRIRSIHHKKSS